MAGLWHAANSATTISRPPSTIRRVITPALDSPTPPHSPLPTCHSAHDVMVPDREGINTSGPLPSSHTACTAPRDEVSSRCRPAQVAMATTLPGDNCTWMGSSKSSRTWSCFFPDSEWPMSKTKMVSFSSRELESSNLTTLTSRLPR